MARVKASAKKQQELTTEELLDQALVPVEEQQYPVPENWVWTRTGKVIQVIMGQSPKGEDTTDDNSYPGLIGGAADMGDSYPSVSRYTTKPTKLSKKNDVILSIRATLGRPIFSDGEYCLGRGVSALRSDFVSSSFIRYFVLNSEEYLHSVATGTTFAQISKDDLECMPLPLPPLAEQQRIVDRIESLFAKLDQAKELAQNALDCFETRKAAILHKAFTGELTAKWREEHGVGMDSWQTIPLAELAYIQTGLAKGKENNSVTTTMPYLRVANVQDGYLDLSEIKLITVEKDKIERYRLKEGDVLFTEGGDYDKLGRGTVWRAEIDNCLHQNHVFAVRPEPAVLNSFYLAYLASSRYGKTYFLSCSKQTTNLASINSAQLKAFPVFCPSIMEQQEIVHLLDTLIEEEQCANYKLEPLLDQISLMKKSILALAFRGELVTNDPSEESALEFLKEVVLL